MRKLGIDEWVIRLVKVMYNGADSRVRVKSCFSERFEVTVGVHQGSVLGLLLFAIVMEAVSRECCIGCPWELLYADDLIIMSNNLEDLQIQLQAWRTSLDTWGLRANVGKTKVLSLLGKAQKPTTNVKWPCGVCSKGVGVNSILCRTCNLWIHNRCSGVKGTLEKENMFRCKKCKDESAPTDSLNSTQIHVGEDTFENVPTFQYLGDYLSGEWGGCVDATSTCIAAAWRRFRQLLPIMTNCGILLRNLGNIFSSCIRKSLLYGCETWPASSKTIHCLISTENSMVHWICGCPT